MKRLITIGCGCLCASLLATAVATAGNPTSDGHARKLAAKQCAGEKKADRAAFRQRYGKHAMRNCIKGASDEAKAELKNAAKKCKAERADDPDAFREAWGTNHNGRNAHGKCVSSQARAAAAKATEDRVAAAETCKTESADKAAFATEFGSGKNAFGKCVSKTAKELAEAEQA